MSDSTKMVTLRLTECRNVAKHRHEVRNRWATPEHHEHEAGFVLRGALG